jgi:hypothetical protein
MQQGVQTEERIRSAKTKTQFPHPNYGGLVEGYTCLLDLPSPLKTAPKDKASNQILAVNYPSERTLDVKVIESNVRKALSYSERGGWTPNAIFQSWCGRWTVHCNIHHHAGEMDDSFNGTATFYPRPPSVLPTDPSKLPPSNRSGLNRENLAGSVLPAIAPETQQKGVSEYLYHETGIFTTSNGISF